MTQTALAEAALDVLLIPSLEAAPHLQRTVVATEPMVFISPPSTVDTRALEPIEVREAARTTLILPTDACGLSPLTRKVFADCGLAVSSYAGEADDCRVIQDWVALGLGSALLPRSKVVDGTPARPVHLDAAPVTISYELCWLPTSSLGTEITAVAAMMSTLASVAPDSPRRVQVA